MDLDHVVFDTVCGFAGVYETDFAVWIHQHHLVVVLQELAVRKSTLRSISSWGMLLKNPG